MDVDRFSKITDEINSIIQESQALKLKLLRKIEETKEDYKPEVQDETEVEAEAEGEADTETDYQADTEEQPESDEQPELEGQDEAEEDQVSDNELSACWKCLFGRRR